MVKALKNFFINYNVEIFLFLTPLFYLLFFTAPAPLGMGAMFANDFSDHRFFWKQSDIFWVLKGYIPFWDPIHQFGGVHFYTNGFSFYNPFSWIVSPLIYLGYNHLAHILQIALHMGFALLGIYKILREYTKINVTAATFASLLFLINQRFNDCIRYTGAIEAIAWVPWIIYTALKLISFAKIDRERIYYGIYFSFSLAISILAGYPHMTYMGGLLLAIILAITLLTSSHSPHSPQSHILPLLFWTLIALIISQAAVYGIYDAIKFWPNRAGADINWNADGGVISYINLILHPFSVDVHSNFYFFPLIWLLAIIGIFVSFRSSKYRFFWRLSLAMFIAAILILDLSKGLNGYSFKFFFKHVPFFSGFRIPGRNNWITMIPIAFFTGIAIDYFEDLRKKNYKLLIIYSLIFIFSSVGLYFLHTNILQQTEGLYVLDAVTKLTTTSKFNSYYYYLLFLSLFFIICYLWVSKFIYKSFLLLLLVILFVSQFARYATWTDTNISLIKKGVSISEAFPFGILEQYKNRNRTLSGVGIVQEGHLFTYRDTYLRLMNADGQGDLKFPSTRMLWIPVKVNSNESENENKNACAQLLSMGANHLKIKLNTTSAGELIYLMGYHKKWKSNIPYKKLDEPYDNFFKFNFSSAGEHIIEMQFRPWKYVVTGFFTLFSIFALIIFCCYLKKKKYLVITLSAVAFLILSFYIYGSYNNSSLSDRDLYGLNDVSLSKSCLLPIISIL
ncbi:MAG: hypothetical protein HQK49_11585 [Oligoflexia bacterium]|nr:hypothetical protein [Oligoflexia bacterium]